MFVGYLTPKPSLPKVSRGTITGIQNVLSLIQEEEIGTVIDRFFFLFNGTSIFVGYLTPKPSLPNQPTSTKKSFFEQIAVNVLKNLSKKYI